MIETQDSICAWANETFGPVTTTARVVARANEEMAELLRCLTTGADAKAPEECADVAIVLCRAAKRLGIILTLDSPPAAGRGALPQAAHANISLGYALVNLASDDQHPMVLYEIRDVVGHLSCCCTALGTSLADAIDAKMKINRARVWKKDGTGHGYHVPQG